MPKETPPDTIECPECKAEVKPGKDASIHARNHWLNNPNVGINDLKGEALRRYRVLVPEGA